MSALDRTIDEYLILQSQDGDDAALKMLIERWQPNFMRFATLVTRNPDMAADAVQDAWIKIIRSLHNLRDPVAWESWSHRILSRLCIDRMRQARRYMELETEQGFNPEQQLLNQDAVTVVLSQLDEVHRVVLALHYLQGFAVVEVASILRIPAGTVKSRLHKARQVFKDAIETDGAKDGKSGRKDKENAGGHVEGYAFGR